ncbi:MAG: heparin lyase I family protein, partial [Pseudonocardia sp.]|nr:heparin lyase I family protein [Pseudonocardia sp.]
MGSRLLVRRRFLHGPGQCRAGCGACLGSVIAGLRRAGRPRRAVVAAVGALAVAAAMVVLPVGRDLMPWRAQATVLASELALVGPEPGTPAAGLAQDLALLGYTPSPDDPEDPPPEDSRDEQSDEPDESDEQSGPSQDSGVDEEGDGLDDQADDDSPSSPSAETSAVDPDGDRPEPSPSAIRAETEPGTTRSASPGPTAEEGDDASSGAADPGAMAPITVSGDQILRGGEPWWFLGYNSFVWSGDCGHDDEKMSAADVEQWFSQMRHDGHGAVRLFFYDGWDIERLDAAVASAKRHNVYLTITLDDAIGGCGENDKDASWFADQSEREVYQAHMEMLLERYRGETAFAWFEFFNEPDYADGALREFYDEMGAAADAVDPDRLFASGTVAPYWVDGEDNFLDIHRSDGVDVASMHEYDEGEVESNHGPGVRANAAGKPVIVGEFGITAGQGCDSNFASRADRVADKAQAYTGDGYVGAFAWAWQPGGGGCELGNLDADTATQEVLREFAADPADLDTPTETPAESEAESETESGSGTAAAGQETDPDAGGDGWERTAQDLAEALAASEDPAARALVEALTRAGFAPNGAPDAEQSSENRDSDDPGPDEGSAEPGAGAGELLWEADVETGDLSQFTDGGDPQQAGSPEPEIVSDPVRDGETAVAFTIPGGGQRNEVLPGPEFSEGDERWFGFSTFLQDGFPTDAGWSLIAQWKNDGTGSPPLELSVEGGQYALSGGYGHPDGAQTWSEPLADAVTGAWVDWTFHIVFSDGADALVEVWKDGEAILTGFSPAAGTLYPGLDSYLKLGYYRDTAI